MELRPLRVLTCTCARSIRTVEYAWAQKSYKKEKTIRRGGRAEEIYANDLEQDYKMASLIPVTVLNFARFLLSSRPPLPPASFFLPHLLLVFRSSPALSASRYLRRLLVAHRIEKNQQPELKGIPKGWFLNSFARRFQWVPLPWRTSKPWQIST